jgi:hypothetical protein
MSAEHRLKLIADEPKQTADAEHGPKLGDMIFRVSLER